MIFALYKSANVRLQIQMDTKRLRPFPENRVIRQAQKVSRLRVAQVALGHGLEQQGAGAFGQGG